MYLQDVALSTTFDGSPLPESGHPRRAATGQLEPLDA